MTNSNKARGTRWETTVTRFLQEFPLLKHARRIAATGALDEGDVHAWPFMIQAKARKAFDLAGWVRDAEAQSQRAAFPYAVVVAKSPGKPTDEGFAVMRLSTFRRLASDYLEATGREVEK